MSIAFSWHLYASRRRELVRNAQLTAQVQARSGELSLALQRLAERRGADGSLAQGLELAGRFMSWPRSTPACRSACASRSPRSSSAPRRSTAQAPGLKLLDFGIAKLHDAVARTDGATEARMIIGTPGYMAPEQAGGARDVTDRADVYAVGVLLFQLVTALPPSQARAPSGDTLGLLIAACLRDEPGARPAAAGLAAELRAVADDARAPSLERVTQALKAHPGGHPPESLLPTTPQRRNA